MSQQTSGSAKKGVASANAEATKSGCLSSPLRLLHRVAEFLSQHVALCLFHACCIRITRVRMGTMQRSVWTDLKKID